MRSAATEETSLRKELGLRDLVLAQVLCVVGSAWVGVAAKLGRAHVVFWLVATLLFYLPLAAVVIHLNRLKAGCISGLRKASARWPAS